ncbi:MAG TPA: ABC transporter permease [Micromonosporaceae bacterium]|nr:ABC transporter permease [Micromonosporaceae bacterium]
MAVAPAAATQPAAGVRRVRARHFVRLKLRVMGNNFRGKGWRIALFISGAFFGLWFAVGGFFLAAAPGFGGSIDAALLVAAFGGGLLVLGWLFVPLVFFGVDETLDPARFALLPLPRRTLVTGLFAAALAGVPAVFALIATTGLVVSAAMLGGWAAGLGAAVGIVAGLLLCVSLSRAVTSAFAAMLRSRRVRDLAAVLLAVLAALLGPLQLAAASAAQRADWDRLTGIAEVIGWTPLAAPYTIGVDIAAGRGWAAPAKLLITALTIGALLWWWSRSLESAMVGNATGGATSRRQNATGGAVDQLFPRALPWLPRNRYGALVAREARYWWRDMRRRAGLITFAVVGIFVPVMVNLGSTGMLDDLEGFDRQEIPFQLSPITVGLSMVFVGALAAVSLANQFGYDGSAYAANVITGVPGKVELRARVVAYSLYIVPLLIVIPFLVALLLGEPGWIGAMVGTLFAAYGSGLAANLFVSVLAPYDLPETSNPFAINTGAGVAKSALSMLALLGGAAVALPMVAALVLLGDVWLWLAPPVGLAYGIGAAALGTYLAGDVLDRRMPELLVAVTPRR